MSLSRILSSSLRNRCAVSVDSLKRIVPVRRFHSGRPMKVAEATKNRPVLPERTPTSRSWSSYVIPTAVIAGVGGLAFFLHYNDERRAIPKGQEVKFQRSTIEGPIIGGPFSLIDTEGRVVTEKSLLGNWVLLYFGYTSSPDVGPSEVQKMAKAVDALESKQNLRVLPIFVTLDPHRDTPAHLRAYLREFDQRIVGLTGPVTAIRQMAQEYRVFFRKVDEEGDDYLVESSHKMYLLDPKMVVVKCFGEEYNAEELSEAIAKELKKSSS
ncbi:OLC1v1009234C1 [Oldenlandia corymbosa var. corymbosa]|uniref:OLC1v1009234C1 n=1 Tax=Oldenlandia corymbosa var. corymbosa TaxID=529605 RepID=A0AAV1DNJ6_OLDCO|nr:OLC1v1009234C1 [Oldenlandia corymbosa var. corymbosa]